MCLLLKYLNNLNVLHYCFIDVKSWIFTNNYIKKYVPYSLSPQTVFYEFSPCVQHRNYCVIIFQFWLMSELCSVYETIMWYQIPSRVLFHRWVPWKETFSYVLAAGRRLNFKEKYSRLSKISDSQFTGCFSKQRDCGFTTIRSFYIHL